MVDRLEVLYEVADLYNARFPGGTEPFRILSRLTEELGEIAAEVNHLERTGAKVVKRGEPEPKNLGYEIADLLHNALALARYYEIEDVIDQAARETHEDLRRDVHRQEL